MKNKITDLNDHLFAELERLGDEALQGETLEDEISRAKALSQVADRIIDNARLVLEATELERNGAHISLCDVEERVRQSEQPNETCSILVARLFR